MNLRSAYKGVHSAFRRYWSVYGGLPYVLGSPFCHAALLLTLLCGPFWWSGDWWEKSFAILPSLLGFSIAAFALLLAVGDDKFKAALGKERKGGAASTLNDLASKFFHFLLVQVIAIVFAFLALGRPATWIVANISAFEASTALGLVLLIGTKVFRFVGFFLLAYSVLAALAATLSLFRVATIFSRFVSSSAAGSPSKDTSASASGSTNSSEKLT
jgi:hypothetical protein